jgi:hypothetical protein
MIELTRCVTAADHGTHRCAGHDVGLKPIREQRLQYPDVRKSASRAAAERNPNGRATRDGRRRFWVRLDGPITIAFAPQQPVQHD